MELQFNNMVIFFLSCIVILQVWILLREVDNQDEHSKWMDELRDELDDIKQGNIKIIKTNTSISAERAKEIIGGNRIHKLRQPQRNIHESDVSQEEEVIQDDPVVEEEDEPLPQRKHKKHTHLTNEQKEELVADFMKNPTIDRNILAKAYNISKSTANKIIRKKFQNVNKEL